jgi:hypothetical protein
MKTRTLVVISVLVVAVATVIILCSCDNGGGGGGAGAITIEYSTPLLNKGDEGYVEGTGIFTFDDNGVPQSYDAVVKMETSASADGIRFLLMLTETGSGTIAFEQFVEHTSELQNYSLTSFDDPVPAFNTNSPDYTKWTKSYTWQNNLLQEETSTTNGIIGMQRLYYYNPNDTLKATRYSEGGNFFGASWYLYSDPTFPFLYTEDRDYNTGGGTTIPPDYDYATDPDNYKTRNDRKYIATPNAKGQLAEHIQQEGDAWTSSWTNSAKLVFTYDNLGRHTVADMYEWSGSSWILIFRFKITYSGNTSSIWEGGFQNPLGSIAFMPWS